MNNLVIRAPRGSELTCKNWVIEAAYRMIQNNLDPEVAENPAELVVYGGIGKAAIIGTFHGLVVQSDCFLIYFSRIIRLGGGILK